MNEHDLLNITVMVTNIGRRSGQHTMMLFLYDIIRRVTPEYKLLKRFSKIHLDPGNFTTVSWTLGREDFKFIGVDHRLQK